MRAICAALVLAILGGTAPLCAQAVIVRYDLNIPRQSLDAALKQFAQQTGLQIARFSDSIDGKGMVGPVEGNLSIDEALTSLLAPHGLSYKLVNDRTIAVVNPSDPPVSGDATSRQKGSDVRTIDEIVVTGTRLPAVEDNVAVQSFQAQDIRNAGHVSAASFLNTLPAASMIVDEANNMIGRGSTTVLLRGLPLGNTLVLLNGRRVAGNGVYSGPGVFDLNLIPVNALERVDVLTLGSSAVYGADAVAGAVNFVLRQSMDGLELASQYGYTDGRDEITTSAAFGLPVGRGNFATFAYYEKGSRLQSLEREISADKDYRRFGAADLRVATCDQGNIVSTTAAPLPGTTSTFAAVPAGSSQATQAQFAQTAGTRNLCATDRTFYPETQKYAFFGTGRYPFATAAELFTELTYSHNTQKSLLSPAAVSNQLIPAANPYNPFGVPVRASLRFSQAPRQSRFEIEFYRALFGLRGGITPGLSYEVTAWQSRDNSHVDDINVTLPSGIAAAANSTVPATALNPFIDTAFLPLSTLQSLNAVIDGTQDHWAKQRAVSALIRGRLPKLVFYDIRYLFGLEYLEDEQFGRVSLPPLLSSVTGPFSQKTRAAFAELRVPLLRTSTGDERLAISAAGRMEHIRENKEETAQYAVTYRPLDALAFQAGYSQSFRSPRLTELLGPVNTLFGLSVVDPRTSTPVTVTTRSGGNPDLEAQDGYSWTLGASLEPEGGYDFHAGINYFYIELNNNIQGIAPQLIVNNEALFPGRVVRDANGQIQLVDFTRTNFGLIRTDGIDYDFSARFDTDYGAFTPQLRATQVFSYDTRLLPSTSIVSNLSRGGANWAPRWKINPALGWSEGPLSIRLGGRYLSRYVDYDGARTLGDYWLLDAGIRFEFDEGSGATDGLYIAAGGLNLLDRKAQYSSLNAASWGYDSNQYDIRGRSLYVSAGKRW